MQPIESESSPRKEFKRRVGPDGKSYLCNAEMAQLSGLTKARISQLASKGDLPAYRFPASKMLWFLQEDVEAFLTPSPVIVDSGSSEEISSQE